jgi:4-amino-4-deoxy-L-arabinose transferase-like glycosyltransferase
MVFAGASMKLVRACFYIALIVSVTKFVQVAVAHPYGHWDSWSIWKRAALFLYYGSPHTFSLELWHPDYPLFYSGLIALLWRIVGEPHPLIPLLVNFAFTFGSFALLFVALQHLTTELHAYLITGFLMVTPDFIWYGVSQMADVPFSFFVLLTGISLVIARRNHSIRWMILAGVAVGVALHTKNEGALFLVAVVAYLIIVGRLASWRLSLTFLVSVLPFVLLYLYFKVNIVPPNDIINESITAQIPKLLDLSRYGTLILFSLYFLAVYVFIVAAIWGVLASQQTVQIKFEPVFLIVIFVLLGYGAIFLITPYNLTWHIVTAMERLILHVWSLRLFCLGLTLQAKAEMPAQTSEASA